MSEREHVTCSGCGVTLTCWTRDDLGRWIMPPCPVCELRERLSTLEEWKKIAQQDIEAHGRQHACIADALLSHDMATAEELSGYPPEEEGA